MGAAAQRMAEMDGSRCGYQGCPNPGESHLIEQLAGIGRVEFSVNLCDSHYDLRDIDDDVMSWLKEEWRKQAD
jgi:hypothetical protein